MISKVKMLNDVYQKCINEFISKLSEKFLNEIIAVILQGGAARDSTPIKSWSDIDLIIIFEEYNPLLTKFLGEISNKLNIKYTLRMDFKVVYRCDIKDSFRRTKYCSSEVMNALNKRGIKILYGSIDSIKLDGFDEKEAVYVYLNVTLLVFRQYYMDNIYYNFDNSNYKTYLQRILRMVFSIIRSSLRLLDIYVNPYRESLTKLKKLNILSQRDLNLLEKLISIRSNFESLDTTNNEYFLELFADIERFVEYYINFAIDNFKIP